MRDNILLIKELLDFQNEMDFYYLMIIKRKKDQPVGEKDNVQSERTIKTYCIESVAYLEKHYEEIKKLCEMFQARAYIYVQRQNHKDISLDMNFELAKRMKSGAHNQENLFSSMITKIKIHEKIFLIDIDGPRPIALHALIDSFSPVGPKVYAIIPTRNGCHFITKPFDTRKFTEYFPKIEIKKKSPTLLYYPDSLG